MRFSKILENLRDSALITGAEETVELGQGALIRLLIL
jgi:hypothetical protein